MNDMLERRTIVLFCAANPVDSDELRLGKEAREIENSISGASLGGRFEFRTKWALQVEDLLGALNQYRPEIVHFSGHGKESGILLELTNGYSCQVGVDALSNLFATVQGEVRCVVLNACWTEDHAVALSKHVDVAIGMSCAIEDVAARTFSAAFYQSLAAGRSVIGAYEQAIAMMVMKCVGCEDAPKFHSRPGSDPASLVFATSSPSTRTVTNLTVVIHADLDAIDSQKLGQIMGELRKLSGDIRLEIGRVSQGSVRLHIQTTPEGAREIRTHYSAGRLSNLRGFAVLDVIDKNPKPKGHKTDDPDLELLEQWRAGDKEGGAALYRRYFPAVRSYFITRVPEAQEDLISDTFLALVKAKDRFEGKSRFKTYLFRIARYTYISYLRKYCRPGREIDPASDSIADLGQRRASSLLAEREHFRLLLDSLRALPIDDQDLLELYYFEGLTGEQLADVFGVKQGTIRSRILAAKQRLARQFMKLANTPHEREWTEGEFATWMSETAEIVRQGRLRVG